MENLASSFKSTFSLKNNSTKNKEPGGGSRKFLKAASGKSDGTEVDQIDIDNNKPVYEVDPVTDHVFYVYKNELRIFSKK